MAVAAPLPSDREALVELKSTCELIEICCSYVRDRLAQVEDGSKPLTPVKIETYPHYYIPSIDEHTKFVLTRPEVPPGPGTITTRTYIGHNTSFAMNQLIACLAHQTLPVLGYLDLYPTDKDCIRSLTDYASGDSAHATNARPAEMQRLRQNCTLAIAGELTPDGSQRLADQNALKVRYLYVLFDRLSQANGSLLRRMNATINPPTIADRMTADPDATPPFVTLDGKTYRVTCQAAIYFKHLIKANGEIVSGKMIAEHERTKEFKVTRAREGLHRDLEKIAVIVPTRGSKIVL